MTVLLDFPQGQGQPRLQACFEQPYALLEAWAFDEIKPLIEAIEAHAENGRWAFGMMAYEAAPAFDPAFETLTPSHDLPLAAFAVFDRCGAWDHSGSKPQDRTFACSPWRHDTSRADFATKIEKIRQDIAAGDYYQTNFTTRLEADFSGDARAFFLNLCEAQPEAYALYLDFGGWQIASVSPELFFAWDPHTRALLTRPMKGTAPAESAAETLKTSAKDRAENLMIVDLMRNDISRIADDVRVPDLFTVEALPTALQMTSTIVGTTRPHVKLVDVFSALFPCGSVTGAPKIAAMKVIAAYETSPRGAYCGALGVVQPGGKAIFSVGIRGVAITNGKAVCGVGSGVTWGSKPADEYAEGRIKQRFLWRASASFDLLETMRLENGVYWLLQRHLDRLGASAANFGFSLDERAVHEALEAVTVGHGRGLFRVRLRVDRKGHVMAEACAFDGAFIAGETMGFAAARRNVQTVGLGTKPIAGDDDFMRHKTTHRAMYEAFAPADPAIFDTLLYNDRGEITEFTRGNVAVSLQGCIVTPPETLCLLPGTLRAELLANGALQERIVTRDDVLHAEGLWFLNGLRGIIPVRLERAVF